MPDDVTREAPVAGSSKASVSRLPGGVALLVLLALLLIVDSPALQREWRFFQPASLYDASGVAPVPQDDTRTPAIDAGFRHAAALLPTSAVCVIAVDSWRREYFRASYLLQPRRVWPAVQSPTRLQPPSAEIAATASLHGADCLLAFPGEAMPEGWTIEYAGAVVLYGRAP